MCGFTGFIDKGDVRKRSDIHHIARGMMGTLNHRGPDHADLWQDPDVPVVLGHLRLSILDLSSEGNQPMSSSSDRYVIVYNGEVYNYLDLQKDLESQGVIFHGRSDTEVILAAIEQWGLNLAIQKINGMFAFALWDRKEREIHFARDRLGKKPLYIGWAGQSLVFGSELKALCAYPDFRGEINRQALGLYMQYGYVPAPHCIYKNVISLPAGHRLSVSLDSIEPGADIGKLAEPYWHHVQVLEQSRAQMRDDMPDYLVVGEFEELLESCVRDRLISDVPLGAFLSGGIDSSSIVALMTKASVSPVNTYSIGFHEEGYNEAEYAKDVATHLGTQHHEMYVSAQDSLDIVPKLADMYDEPFADYSAIPTYLVSEFARRYVTVALSGDGGDEMLGGYNRHVMGPKIWNRMRMIPAPLRKMIAGSIHGFSSGTWDKIGANSRPQFGRAMYKLSNILRLNSPQEIYESLTKTWDDPALLSDADSRPTLYDHDIENLDLDFAQEMMLRDTLFYLTGDILTKVDRASMAVSLEVRAPLLDRRIYEYVWSLPMRFKIRDGKGKWLLRQVLSKYVPDKLFERPKQGFTVPIDGWLRGPLKDWAEDLLDEQQLKSAGFLESAHVRGLWTAHRDGNADHGTKLWTILMFQAWQRRWL